MKYFKIIARIFPGISVSIVTRLRAGRTRFGSRQGQ